MPLDLIALRQDILQGRTTPQHAVENSLQASQSAGCTHAFTHTDAAGARAAAASPALAQPLAGIAVSVKALFDVQGWVTHAGALCLSDRPAAVCDAPAVARLRAAGASLVGHTHMVEFAFSGVGTNPHHPTPAAFDALYQRPLPEPRIPGGSSSGAAVSVASGAAWIGLGSDTGGSIRIPAALNGLVGFKSTACRVPLAGTLPLSSSLDTACAITRSVRDAVVAHSILAARSVARSHAALGQLELAVPHQFMLDDADPAVVHAFHRTLDQLRRAGARITEIDLPELHELARINAQGGLTAAESYALHRPWLAAHGEQYDPRVRVRIERGALMSAADYLDVQRARADWIARMEQRLAPFDALLSPTTPITAPLMADVAPADGQDAAADAARDACFQRTNALLLRNTSVVNMLDGCALSLPCHQPDELPMGLMVWHAAMHDDVVLHASARIEAVLRST